MKFTHTYAVHSCFKCKAYSHTSKGSPNWCLFYLSVAVTLAIPLWAFSMLPPLKLPWYYGFSTLAGELLLFYFVGLVCSIVLSVFDLRPTLCPTCRAPLLSAGRYFRKGEKPNYQDAVLLILNVIANVAIWIVIIRHRQDWWTLFQ